METKTDFTQNYYAKLAAVHGDAPHMSMRDQYIRDKEVEFFSKSIERSIAQNNKTLKILDLGCGNAHLLKLLGQNFTTDQIELTGLEYSPELYQICQQQNLNAHFVLGDMREKNQFSPNQFDLILSQRSIINILKLKEQKQSLINISQWLKPGGIYLCSESFREPLHQLTMACQEMNFPEIKPSKHNLFLWRAYFEKELIELGLEKEDPALAENSLSTHFYMTRVIHRLIRPRKGKKNPKFFKEFFHQALEPTIGDFSPILFYQWRKKLLLN